MNNPVYYQLHFKDHTYLGTGCCITHATEALMNSLDRNLPYNQDHANLILNLLDIVEDSFIAYGNPHQTVNFSLDDVPAQLTCLFHVSTKH